MKRLIVLIISIAILGSCKKDSINLKNYYQCNATQNFGSTAITNKLAGSWVWKKYACGNNPELHTADKTVKITFNSNGTFVVLENAVIITQGTWSIAIIDSSLYGLVLSQPSIYLYGRILFCDDEVLFNDSYIDGCDHLFSKTN